MLSFLKWLAGYYLFRFMVVAVMLVSGLAAVLLSEDIIDFFDLDDDSGMYLKLGFFVVVVGVILWAHDKYKEWRFFKDE